MDRWQAMKVFVKVGEAGSFSAAGRRLNMKPACRHQYYLVA